MKKHWAAKTRFSVVIGGVLTALVFMELWRLSNATPSKLFSALQDPQFTALTLSIVISLLTGILSAWVYGTIENRECQKLLETYRSMAPGGLFEDVFASLKPLNGRFMADYNLLMELKKPKTNNSYYNLNLSYDYKKVIQNRHLTFKFLVLKNQNETDVYQKESSSPADFTLNELVQILPEMKLRESVKDPQSLDGEHFVKDLFIDSVLVPLSHSATEPFTWSAEIPLSIDISNPIRIRYLAQFPLQLSDFTYQLLEFPCKNTTIKFSYEEVEDEVTVESFDFFTSETGPVFKFDLGEHRFDYPKWALAKSGASFIWTQKPH